MPHLLVTSLKLQNLAIIVLGRFNLWHIVATIIHAIWLLPRFVIELMCLSVNMPLTNIPLLKTPLLNIRLSFFSENVETLISSFLRE